VTHDYKRYKKKKENAAAGNISPKKTHAESHQDLLKAKTGDTGGVRGGGGEKGDGEKRTQGGRST